MLYSMVGKEVVYNGKTDACFGSSDHNLLVKGKRYIVTCQTDRGCQTDYNLKGVKGSFNSIWFNEVKPKKTHFAHVSYSCLGDDISKYIGKCINLTKHINVEPYFEDVMTSCVQSIDHIYGNVYKIETENTVYIVEFKEGTMG